MDIRQISKEKLEEVISTSVSWSEAMRKVGKTSRGASFQYFQSRVKKLGLNTSHFLGKSSHSGPRQTGIARKKQWSEILIKKTIKIREDGRKLRRAYTEYCEENNIPIRCVDCGNDWMWLGKKLILEINHKDECRWNNEPKNLEWVCPNCHSVKTIY